MATQDVSLRPGRGRWLPTPPDVLFAAILAWLFVLSAGGWSLLLADGDTGWHIRTGEWILAERQVPRVDLFSFSKAGQPWYAWEWGADIVFALIHRAGGLAWLAFFSGTLLVGTAIALLRYMAWRGGGPVVLFPIFLCAVGGSTLHYLARPHIFTLLFVLLSLWVLDRQRREPTAWIWSLVPLTVLWTNLHGGWPALFVFLGIQITVHFFHGDPRWRQEATVGLACAAATLLNPYGWQLHGHIWNYLQSDWIRESVDEFQSPKFRSENLLQFEVLLILGLAAAGSRAQRGSAGQIEALGVLVWAHLALGAVRHAPIFILAAAPVLAAECTSWIEKTWKSAPKSTILGIFREIDHDLKPAFAANSLWALVFALGIWWGSQSKWPLDFPSSRFPTAAIAHCGSEFEAKRIFLSDQWADYLLYRQWPKTLAYIDGRSDFYGRQIGEEALSIASAESGWEQKLSRRGMDYALLPRGSRLAKAMRDAGWQVLHMDALSVALRRSGPSRQGER